MLELYKNIKNKRNELHISQEELANKVGYTDRSMIAKVEKGGVDLTQTKIALFAKALQSTPSELMGWEEEEKTADALIKVTESKELQSIVEESSKLSNKSKKRLMKYIELLQDEDKEND